MKNFISEAHTIDVVLAAPVEGGDMALVGTIFGVFATSGGVGDVVALRRTGMYDLPKAAVAVTLGAALHYDSGNDVLTTNDEAGPRVATAGAPAATGASSVYAILEAPILPATVGGGG